MMANSPKETKFIFRIEEDLLEKYKSICEKNGYDISKRLRLFIKDEIKLHNNKVIEQSVLSACLELMDYANDNTFTFYIKDSPKLPEYIKMDLCSILNKHINRYNYIINCDKKIENGFIVDIMIENLTSNPHVLTLKILSNQ